MSARRLRTGDFRDYGHEGQIGLEKSPNGFTQAIVEVFQCVWRVLRDDGVVWLNLGDSYVGGHAGRNDVGRTISDGGGNYRHDGVGPSVTVPRPLAGMKPKDLIGVPWRVAFALQADGWYLRSDVIWAKPNPMPESVTDRPTKSHEYVFLLAKSGRYAYDADAIRLPVTEAMLQQMAYGYDGEATKDYESAGVQNPSSVKARIIASKRRSAAKGGGHSSLQLSGRGDVYSDSLRANARTVWTIATEPSSLEHFG